MANYIVQHFDDIAVETCPCGYAQRAFVRPDNPTVTVHFVEITHDAKTHYHKRQTETYVVLEGNGAIECDGHMVPAKPMTAVLIKPGCRHRAVGRLKILNIVTPAFDPKDEYVE